MCGLHPAAGLSFGAEPSFQFANKMLNAYSCFTTQQRLDHSFFKGALKLFAAGFTQCA